MSLMGATILSFSSLSWYSSFVKLPEVGRLSWSDTFFLIVLFKPVKVTGMLFSVLGEISACWIWELGLLFCFSWGSNTFWRMARLAPIA